MNALVEHNSLFSRVGIENYLEEAKGPPPSEFAELDGLAELVDELRADGGPEERTETCTLLARVLGFDDVEWVAAPHELGDDVLTWLDARIDKERRVSLLFVDPHVGWLSPGTAVGVRGEPLPPARALVDYLERSRVPWGIVTDGLRWQLHARDTVLPLQQSLRFDLNGVMESGDEQSFLAVLTLLSSAAAMRGSLWDSLLAGEKKVEQNEARLWERLCAKPAGEEAALALFAEWAGTSARTPLLKSLTASSKPNLTAVRRALSQSLHGSSWADERRKGAVDAVWVGGALRLLKELPIHQSPLVTLRILAAGMDGKRATEPLPEAPALRQLVENTGALASGARMLLAGTPRLELAASLCLAELTRAGLSGRTPAEAATAVAQNFFAVDASEDQAARLRRLLAVFCQSAGGPAPYLAHRVRAGNPHLSAAVSSLATPASGRGRRAASDGPRQISFVEAHYLDRLQTLASDLALLSAAGPERADDIRRQEGIFRRLERGIERFRDLADLWLLTHESKPVISVGDYETLLTALREGDEEWAARIAPYEKALTRLRKQLAPFHWELELPELYVEGGGRRIDPGFHLIVLSPPDAAARKALASLRAYLKSLAGSAPGPQALQARLVFAGLFRTSRGALLTGPLTAAEERAVHAVHREARSVLAGAKSWVALER